MPDSTMLMSLADELDVAISLLPGEPVTEPVADDLKSISEKLEVINLQLARRHITIMKTFPCFSVIFHKNDFSPAKRLTQQVKARHFFLLLYRQRRKKDVDAVLRMMSDLTGDNRFEMIQNDLDKGEEITMCEVLDRVEERGIKRGIEQGEARNTCRIIERYAQKHEISTLEACNIIGISYDEYQNALQMLKKG